MNTKTVNCSGVKKGNYIRTSTNATGSQCSGTWGDVYRNCFYPPTPEYLTNRKKALDYGCKTLVLGINESKQIIMSNNTIYYDMSLKFPFSFAVLNLDSKPRVRVFASPNPNIPSFLDANGFGNHYRVLCMDIDGIPDNATADDCVNECPFGYGIRADGKILNGARADEWLEKSIQDKD